MTGQLDSQRAGFQAPATQRQQQAHEEHAGNSNGIAVLEGPRDREGYQRSVENSCLKTSAGKPRGRLQTGKWQNHQGHVQSLTSIRWMLKSAWTWHRHEA